MSGHHRQEDLEVTLSPEKEALIEELQARFGLLLRLALTDSGYGVLLAEVWIGRHEVRREPEIAFHSRRPVDRIRQGGR